MKRNKELIRDILLKIESGETAFNTLSKEVAPHLGLSPNEGIPDEEAKELKYHLNLLIKYKWITTHIFSGDGHYHIEGLTWEGHDFLDSVRDREIWRQTSAAADKAGGWTLGVLKEIASEIIKKAIAETVGLPL
jgi:hypothetical protein